MNVKEDMLKKKKEINEKTEIFIFVFLAFILLTTWAMTQPFNSGPDEQMRYYVADYIYKHHGALPGGDDPAVRNKVWGISYAYYPVVSYMVSALFMRISTPPKVCSISPNILQIRDTPCSKLHVWQMYCLSQVQYILL